MMNWLDRKIDDFIRRVRDTRMPIAIGPPDDPTYHRYFVIPRNRFFNVYLHNFHHSDAENLHDHRMANITIVLQGPSYNEERFQWSPRERAPIPFTDLRPVRRLRPLFRWASTPHRVVLEVDPETGKLRTVWSLFIGFPHTRNWGFWQNYRGRAQWFPHEEVVASTDPTSSAYGQNRRTTP